MGKSSMRAGGGRMRWVVLAVVAGLGGVGYMAHQQAKALVARSLNVAFDNGDTDVGRVFFDWNGDAVASDVSLYLSNPVVAPASDAAATDNDLGANTLKFDRLVVRVPGGWGFYLRNLADSSLKKAEVDALHMSFEGFDTRAGVEPTMGKLGAIGALSASPFEAEGCAKHAYFVRDELIEMGLGAGRTTLDYEWREKDSRVSLRAVLNTPGVSRVQFDREETLAEPTSLLRLVDTPTATVSEHWDVADQGFVVARNKYCAKQDGIDEGTFIGRHLVSVQRQLETRGLVADPQTVAAYTDFAHKGGQIAFGGTYATPIHSSERAQAHANGSAMLRMQGTIERGSGKVAVQWRGTTPRPLDAAGGATFAAMTKENGGAAPAVGSVTEPPPDVVVSTVQGGVQTPKTDAPKYASSLPQAAPTIAPGARLAWGDLAHVQGRMLQVFTMHNEPRTAMLMSVNGNEAHVRARMPGGHADYRVSKEAFVRAILIQ
ncbi:hypothetical protein LK996_04035 [Lysobacter sp. A6]|uniref:DUF4340 domain-containing protein n=1 Tax=Noviluteimonas lactosilytica TaxID=2888523 RepID=A0ABS8JF73_9GAMM|nr:hypothetical protein [Lysobacter lactosilyticus]MCC8362242.1 hypothetical protein [Lysobacter lactosilyticus]